MLELDKSRKDIARHGPRQDFFIGCDTKGYPFMDTDVFMQLFTNVFNYATITHYVKSSVHSAFEAQEAIYDWAIRDEQFRKLRDAGVAVEGRPIFWGDGCCTPRWMIDKSYPELLTYLEKHPRDLVSHYGDEMYPWEVINEAHDFNNIMGLAADQMVEIASSATSRRTPTRTSTPHQQLLPANRVHPFRRLDEIRPRHRDRHAPSVHQEVPRGRRRFYITGQQLYYQYMDRDLADTIRMTERLAKYGRPVQITEIGTTSGPTAESIASGELPLPELPYSWHRHWDQELQADWLEQIYTILYSKPWIEAINRYDFVDAYSFIDNGGLLANPAGETKAAYRRLERMKGEWQ